MVGFVLARSSVGLASFRGVRTKYMVAAARLTSTITIRFLNADLISSVSSVPSPRPIPKIGPISGDTSIAPMITAVEFTLRPTDAKTMAHTRIHTLGPLK